MNVVALRELFSLKVELRKGVPEDYACRVSELKRTFRALRAEAVTLSKSSSQTPSETFWTNFWISQIDGFEKVLAALLRDASQRAKTKIANQDRRIACGDFGKMATEKDEIQ